jgi:hypothetical protein
MNGGCEEWDEGPTDRRGLAFIEVDRISEHHLEPIGTVTIRTVRTKRNKQNWVHGGIRRPGEGPPWALALQACLRKRWIR